MKKDDQIYLSRRRLIALGGGLAGAVVGGEVFQGIGKNLLAPVRDSLVISRFDNKRPYLEELLAQYPNEFEGSRAYQSHSESKERLYQRFNDHIESLSRQALKTPGIEQQPVKSLRDMKKKVFEWTKSLGGKDSTEKADVQKDPNYTVPYNTLAQFRLSTMERINSIEVEMNSLAYKILTNGQNGSYQEGNLAIEGLFREHNSYFELMEKFHDLTPEQILEADANKNYLSAIETAQRYGIVALKDPLESKRKTLVAIGSALGFFGGSLLSGGISKSFGGFLEIGKLVGRGTLKAINKKGGRKT